MHSPLQYAKTIWKFLSKRKQFCSNDVHQRERKKYYSIIIPLPLYQFLNLLFLCSFNAIKLKNKVFHQEWSENAKHKIYWNIRFFAFFPEKTMKTSTNTRWLDDKNSKFILLRDALSMMFACGMWYGYEQWQSDQAIEWIQHDERKSCCDAIFFTAICTLFQQFNQQTFLFDMHTQEFLKRNKNELQFVDFENGV